MNLATKCAMTVMTLLLCNSCGKKDQTAAAGKAVEAGPPSAQAETIVTVTVGPQTKRCSTGVLSMDCLVIEATSNQAVISIGLFYEQIDGFEFEAGKTRTINVKVEQIANPYVDGPTCRVTLVK